MSPPCRGGNVTMAAIMRGIVFAKNGVKLKSLLSKMKILA